MFRTLIYFDEKKVLDYKSVLEKKQILKYKNFKVSNDKSGKLQIPMISVEGNIGNKSEIDGEIIQNSLLDCNNFEELLEGKEGYFDFLKGSNMYNIETVPTSSIVKFNANIYMPKEFDMIDMINKFKPFLIQSIETESKGEEEMLKYFLNKPSSKIPIFIEPEEFDNKLCFSKINSNNLYHDIEGLEEIENEEVTILAKLISRKNIDKKPIVVYDIKKDLFSMPRGLRRQLKEEQIEGINDICVNEDFINLEVLAIYQ